MTFDGEEAGSNVIDLKAANTALVPAALEQEAEADDVLVDKALQEAEADDALVDQAFEEVQKVFINAISNSMDTLGDYFFKTFFDKNPDLVRKKQPTKGKSFLKLIERLQKTEVDTPSKSWLYNAVNIAADKAYFEGEKFPEYGKLTATQRVYIARIADTEKKKAVIEETLEKNYSVRELKDRIDEMIERRETLNLEHLGTPENKEKLRKKTPKRLKSIEDAIEEKIRTFNEKQRELEIKRITYRASKDVVSEILEEMKKKQKGKKSK